MHGLTVRTCLAILATGANTGSTCREDEHDQIVQAMVAGDAKRAMKLMSTHLDHIEKALSEPGPPSPDDLIWPCCCRPRHERCVRPVA